MSSSRKPLTLVILTFVSGIGLGFLAVLPVSAHNIGWVWNTYYTNVENRTSKYGTYVSNSVSNYYNSTNISPTLVSSGGNLVHLDTYDTRGSWWAGTVPYSGGTKCVSFPDLVSTGYCNSSDHKVDFTYIYWNSYNIPSTASSTNLNFVARHEMGHSYGLAHISEGGCVATPSSVMQKFVNCAASTSALTSHDVSDINGLYPFKSH